MSFFVYRECCLLKIMHKLLLLLLLSIIIPMATTVVISYQSVYNRMQEEFVSQHTLQAERWGQAFQQSIEQMDKLMLSIYQTKELYGYVTEPPSVSDEVINQQRQAENLLKMLTHSLDEFEHVYLYVRHNRMLHDVDARFLNVNRLQIGEGSLPRWVQEVEDRNGALTLVREPANPAARDTPSLFIGRSIPDVIENREDGAIGIEMGRQYFASVVGGLTEGTSLQIIDGQGSLLYQDGPSFNPDERNIVVASEPNRFGWSIRLSIPTSIFEEAAWSAVKPILQWSVIFILIAVIIWFVFARQISKPLIELVKHMRAVGKGNFQLEGWKADPGRRDEFGFLENQFRSMVHRIEELINVEYDLKMKESVAQIKALQAQINPHFLHNTLTSIYSEAMEANAPNVCRMVKALSTMFRYTTEQHDDLVTLAREMGHIRNYLEIQKFRFEDNLEYDIELPEELEQVPAVKLSIQPLVENAVIHGVSKRGKGHVGIRASLHEGQIMVEVRDTGALLTSDSAQRLTDALRKGGLDDEHVGLRSVHMRILHLFPGSDGLILEAEEGATSVKLFWKTSESHAYWNR